MSQKVAFIVNKFPSVSETFILNQIVDIMSRGYDVRVFALKRGSLNVVHQMYHDSRLADRTTYYTPPSKGRKLKNILVLLVSRFPEIVQGLGMKILNHRKLRQSLERLLVVESVGAFLTANDVDIVHAHFGQRGALVADWLNARKSKKFRFIVSFHGYDLMPSSISIYKSIYKNIFKWADTITVNSEYLLSLLKSVDSSHNHVEILREGLHCDQYKPSDIKHDRPEFVIVFCGRFVPFKGPDLAVRIVGLLVNERKLTNVRLRMIGDGAMRPQVEALIDQYELRGHVELLGSQSQEGVIAAMSEADVFLLPGIHEKETDRAEAQGLVIQEAQAIGLPVVVSDAGGIKYGLLHGESGFVVPRLDIAGFADRIESLMGDAALRLKMGHTGRKFVCSRFDTRVLGDQLVMLYGVNK